MSQLFSGKDSVYALLTTKELDRVQTKGAVLLVCLQCVDTWVSVSKHAEGMSLR